MSLTCQRVSETRQSVCVAVTHSHDASFSGQSDMLCSPHAETCARRASIFHLTSSYLLSDCSLRHNDLITMSSASSRLFSKSQAGLQAGDHLLS